MCEATRRTWSVVVTEQQWSWLVLAALSSTACADILGLSDFTIGEGGNNSTSSSGGTPNIGGSGAGTTTSGGAGGEGGEGGEGGVGGVGGSGGEPNICDDPLNYGNVVVCDMPIVYLRFEEQVAVGPMINESPVGTVGDGNYGSNATLTAGAPGIGGSSLMLGNGRCEVPDNSGVLEFVSFEAYSVEAWVRAPDSADNTFGFIGNWDGTAGWSLFTFPASMDGAQPNLEYKRNAQPNIIQCSDVAGCPDLLDFIDFRHVVATYDPGNGGASLYLDGDQIVTGSLSNALLPTATNFSVVGPSSDTDVVVFDEVAVYDYVLAPDQIKAHYECGAGNGC